MRHHWYKPKFWRWWWHERVNPGVKWALAVVMLFVLGVAGYMSAGKLMTEGEQVVFTERVLTVTRTTIVKGKPRIVTEVRTITTKGEPQTKTVRLNGKTVVVTTPAETVVSTHTIKGPVRKSVVYKNRVRVIPGKVRTITLPGQTLPGSTVTGPERIVTITGPSQTVTSPGETIDREVVRTVTGPTQTVTGPTQTVTGPIVTNTVTGPTTTVTGPTVTVTGQTQTVTHTVTETVTVTEPPPSP